MERFKNNASTTLTSGVNNSSDPVTLAVASAAAFPTDGNFRVIIDSEILTVTAVSGTNFTAARAQEGTSIASHSSGATVTLILTAASLDTTIKDRVEVGALTNYTADNNILYLGNDAPAMSVNQLYMVPTPYIPIRTWDPAGYTWFSQGSSSFVKNSDYMTTFSVPQTGGEQIRGIHVSTGGGSKTIDAWFSGLCPGEVSSSYHLMGVNIGNGSNAKKLCFRMMVHYISGITVLFQYFSDDTTVGATIAQYKIYPTQPLCLRLTYNSGGNTCIASMSYDGLNFINVGTRSNVTSDFTPDYAGVHFENNGGLTSYYNVSNVYIR